MATILEQFRKLKERHPDRVFLFRTGDFYTAYEEDAVICAHDLGITLTTSRKDINDGIPYRSATFPGHALDIYLPRLIRAGKRLAIREQLTKGNK
jgi:DNA mismatch repair ATPase MutS